MPPLPLPLLLVFLTALFPIGVLPHGRLIEPPSRASAWRYGFDTPHNYNDNELYCGGFTRQWVVNGGKCGVCGDPWDSKLPRFHEFGGTYGQGIVVRKYSAGAKINIRVELTASHSGYFEFSVCPNFKNTSQACLDRHRLKILRPQENMDHLYRRYYPKDGNKVYEMKYQLPKMSCKHCLLQWRYIAGNNWGDCKNGSGAVGCGPQEEFRACADISISSKSNLTSTMVDYDDATDEPPQTPTETGTDSPAINMWAYTIPQQVFIVLGTFLVLLFALLLLYGHYYSAGSWRLAAVGRWLSMKRHAGATWFDGKTGGLQEKVGGGVDRAPLPPPRCKRKTDDGRFSVGESMA